MLGGQGMSGMVQHTFCAVWYSSRSVLRSKLTSMRCVPARSYNYVSVAPFAHCVLQRTWKTMPEVMMGVMPSSISVPLLLAIITLSQ